MQINYKRTTYIFAALLAISLLFTFRVLAGSTDSPSAPTNSASQMYTLENIYDRLSGSGDATKMTTFTEPASGPGSTMHTLDDIYDLALPARVPKTGQTDSYATGDDGDLEKGVAWPNPRFTDNSDGTVTDNLTGLIWLDDANCAGATMTWSDALTFANSLYDGWSGDGSGGDCGLSDSSSAGDWRLPNIRELLSLVHYRWASYDPAVPNTAGTGKWTAGDPFTDVQSDIYWSSTFYQKNTGRAWFINLYSGYVNMTAKSTNYYVWPVRAGQ